MQFRLGETSLCDPQTAQDEAKITLRLPQDCLKIVLKRDRFFGGFVVWILVVLGSVLVPFWHPRWGQEPTKMRSFFKVFFWLILGRLGLRFGSLLGPKMEPKTDIWQPVNYHFVGLGLSTVPKTPQDRPRAPQDHPKSPKRPPRRPNFNFQNFSLKNINLKSSNFKPLNFKHFNFKFLNLYSSQNFNLEKQQLEKFQHQTF